MVQAECGRLPQNSGASTDALRKCHRFSPTRMATNRGTIPSAGEDVGRPEVSGIAGGNVKQCSHQTVWKLLKVDPEIPLLGAKMHTRTFAAALFITEETGNSLSVHQLMSG